MNTSLFYHRRVAGAGLLGCALLAVATVANAAPAARHRPIVARSLMQGMAVLPLASDALRENERAFLGKASETTRQHMRLAEVGASQAETTEVRSHALTLAADYRELNESLEALISRKGGIAGAPAGGTSETYQRLLEKSGAEFDREFIRAAAELSSAVMALFERAAADAKDADVREFAAAQLPVLRAHRNAIAELKKTFD